MSKRSIPPLIIALFALHALPCTAQDTTRHPVTLPEISITDHNAPPEALRVQTPTQVLTAGELRRRGSTQLSDAVRQMQGLTLRDYGGVGGVKTVSVRGLGSQFSTLTIDGIAVSDCQNGQIDLGRHLLEGSSHIALTNGQADNLLLPARSLAAGSTVNLESAVPTFGSRATNLSATLEGGSYGYLSPTLALQQRLGRRSSLTLWGNYLRSEGDYPFTLYYTASRADSSSREVRRNSQMWQVTADANYFCQTGPRQRLQVKVHYMQGFHAIPGPVIYYSSKASEFSRERLLYTQARYQHKGNHADLLLLGKYSHTADSYEDTAIHTRTGTLLNEYRQQEGYLSQVLRCHLGDRDSCHWRLAATADESLSRLTSNLASHNDVTRLALLGAVTAEYRSHPGSRYTRGLKASAHLLGTWVQDMEQGTPGTPFTRLSPYAAIAYTWGWITLRGYFKESYRVPNFNELYYFSVSRSLRPEKALQYNLGLTMRTPESRHTWGSQHLELTLDGYHNRVADKILAVPTQNMYLWSMSNVGQAEITGADLSATYRLRTGTNGIELTLSAGYSLQQALDRSDPDSKTYGKQLPYTPRHSGNVALGAATPWVDAALTLTVVGTRYSTAQNTAASQLSPYADQGITLSHTFDTRHGSLTVKAQVLNLFDVQYEVVRNYPMMGRNYRLGLTARL